MGFGHKFVKDKVMNQWFLVLMFVLLSAGLNKDWRVRPFHFIKLEVWLLFTALTHENTQTEGLNPADFFCTTVVLLRIMWWIILESMETCRLPKKKRTICNGNAEYNRSVSQINITLIQMTEWWCGGKIKSGAFCLNNNNISITCAADWLCGPL